MSLVNGCAVMVQVFGSCTVAWQWEPEVAVEKGVSCLIDAGCLAWALGRALAWYVGIWRWS
jgi:hypothetical protein